MEMHALITLRFLASGLFLQVIGDTFLAFHKINSPPSCASCLTSIDCEVGWCHHISIHKAERDEIKQGLFRVGGFPWAIGCIDRTHIRIAAPHETKMSHISLTAKDFILSVYRQSATIEVINYVQPWILVSSMQSFHSTAYITVYIILCRQCLGLFFPLKRNTSNIKALHDMISHSM